MARLPRPPRSLDRDVRDRLGLPSGERPLAWADADPPAGPATPPTDGGGARGDRAGDTVGDTAGDRAGGAAVADLRAAEGDPWVGTRVALYVPTGDGYRRVPWTSVDRADWNDAAQQLRLVELAPFGEVMPLTTGRLRGADRLLQLIRERVTASIVVVRTVPVRGRRGVRVVARRDPDRAVDLTWSAVLDPGLDPGDPTVVAAAERALSQVREEVGLG